MASKAKKVAVPRKKANGYKMPPPIPLGEVIHDTIAKRKWRIGPSIGVGGFGVIYSACDHESSPKKSLNYPFVVKIEPIENGPLFVEKHFYIRNGNGDDIEKFRKAKKLPSLGMPIYFGHGSHNYKGEKFRYLVLERYGKDVWSLFKESDRSFLPATVFQLGLQMLDVLEYIHSRGYVHADLKGANILMGLKKDTENQAYLVDFGLASRVNDKEFKPDPKCAHNGTIEYTSRDAHLGVPTMRGDLEILAYNMLQWLIGDLPWEKDLKHPKAVQQKKETFMSNVRSSLNQYPGVPSQLVKFFEYINTVGPKDVPDYRECRQLFVSYLKTEGKTAFCKLDFSSKKKGKTTKTGFMAVDSNSEIKDNDENTTKTMKKTKVNNEVQKPSKRGRRINKQIENEKGDSENENGENEIPENSSEKKLVTNKNQKRKSSEPAVLVKVKKAKMAPKATPPTKKNHANIATQTSTERPRRSPRQVTFDSPISEELGSKRSTLSVNSSGDIFVDSFVIEEKKVKTKKKLLSSEKVTVKRVVKKKVSSTVNPKGKSWKNCPTIVNGRSPKT